MAAQLKQEPLVASAEQSRGICDKAGLWLLPFETKTAAQERRSIFSAWLITVKQD